MGPQAKSKDLPPGLRCVLDQLNDQPDSGTVHVVCRAKIEPQRLNLVAGQFVISAVRSFPRLCCHVTRKIEQSESTFLPLTNVTFCHDMPTFFVPDVLPVG